MKYKYEVGDIVHAVEEFRNSNFYPGVDYTITAVPAKDHVNITGGGVVDGLGVWTGYIKFVRRDSRCMFGDNE